MRNPFRYFNNSPEVIRPTVMMNILYPLSLREVEDLLFGGGIGIYLVSIRPQCRFWVTNGPSDQRGRLLLLIQERKLMPLMSEIGGKAEVVFALAEFRK